MSTLFFTSTSKLVLNTVRNNNGEKTIHDIVSLLQYEDIHTENILRTHVTKGTLEIKEDKYFITELGESVMRDIEHITPKVLMRYINDLAAASFLHIVIGAGYYIDLPNNKQNTAIRLNVNMATVDYYISRILTLPFFEYIAKENKIVLNKDKFWNNHKISSSVFSQNKVNRSGVL